MGLSKRADQRRGSESGLSLLQGLLILAVLGIIAAVLANHFAG